MLQISKSGSARGLDRLEGPKSLKFIRILVVGGWVVSQKVASSKGWSASSLNSRNQSILMRSGGRVVWWLVQTNYIARLDLSHVFQLGPSVAKRRFNGIIYGECDKILQCR